MARPTIITLPALDIDRADFNDELQPSISSARYRCHNTVLSFFISRTNQCLISVLRVAERPLALIFRLSDIFLSILQRMRKQCSVIDGRNLLVHAPSYPGDMRSNSCLRRLRVHISFLNSLVSLPVNVSIIEQCLFFIR